MARPVVAMNRSITRLGVVIIIIGFMLIASPIVLTGAELFDLEQEAGMLIAPVGLLVVLIGAVQTNPERTTVGGTFGNPEEVRRLRSPASRSVPSAPPPRWNPNEPVFCRYCRTAIAPDLARCPRCARARECRACGRPLGFVLDRATCPFCGHSEASCNCPRLVRTPGATVGTMRPGWG